MVRALCLLTVFLFVACGGDDSTSSGADGAAGTAGTAGTGGGGTGGSGGSSGNAGDAATDAPPADGPFACGTKTCTATQYCIHPCCGGAPPPCEAKPEGGACPAGYHDGCSFGGCNDPAGCCEMDPCTPPPPYCADQPEGGCMLQGHDCLLACA